MSVEKIRSVANKIKADASNDQNTINYYKNVIKSGSVDSVACTLNQCSAEEYLSAVELAVSELKDVVTDDYRVDQYDNVYNEKGEFYCKWDALTTEEQERVKDNPFSAR